uniref:XRE family transcriptional regulator n=1 Tax=Mesoaciditoga lauensis TaxID=1495039 RepID=A0A7V3VSS2_9BACT
MKPGEKIKFLRRSLGLSQQKLSNKVGITRPYLSYLENGIIPTPVHLKEKIARALGVTPHEIWPNKKQ